MRRIIVEILDLLPVLVYLCEGRELDKERRPPPKILNNRKESLPKETTSIFVFVQDSFYHSHKLYL